MSKLANEEYDYLKNGTMKVLVDGAYRARDDINGKNIEDTYATKTEVNNKQRKLKPGTNITITYDEESGMDEISASGMVSIEFKDIAGNPEDNSKLKTAFDAKQDNALVTTMEDADDTHYASVKAVKDFVNSSIQSETAFFDGSWATKSAIPTAEQGFTDAGLPAPTNNNYLVVLADETHSNETWRYKYTTTGGSYDVSKWVAEYKINETALTEEQLKALNSGATSEKISAFSDHIIDGDIHVTTEEKETWDSKVDAVEGMGLSHNDFSDELKVKLENLTFTRVTL